MKNISRWNKSRINFLHFSYSNFCDYDNFLTELLQVLQEDVQYSLLLKVRFNGSQYAMCGVQIGLLYDRSKDFENFERLHAVYMDRLKNFSEDYEVEVINFIQLLYVRVEDMPQLKIENFNQVSFKTFSSKDSKSRFTIIPLTLNVNYFGKLILKDRESYLAKINKERAILNENNLVLSDISSMYLYNDYIIISINKDGIIFRELYDRVGGTIVSKIQDRVLSDNSFMRKIGNNSLTIVNDKIVNIESERNLSSIRSTPQPLKDEPNTLIGSWDIEAFKDSDGYAKVYALGFYVLDGKVNTYYLEDGISSDDLVLKCIDDMLVNEYKGYTFYTHNLGRYDSTFLIKILKDFNVKVGYEHYILNAICRDNKPLKLTIKVKRSLSDRKPSSIGARRDPGFNRITIVDSLNLLNQSLDDLCQSFGVDVVKGNFPHKFVNRKTLNYIGNTPSFDYWNNIALKDYEGLVKPDWNLKEECLKYLEKDLVSLTKIMHKFSEYINRKYHLQVTGSLTISRLALNIFLKEYLKDSKLPIIGKNMFSDIKQAYYGGITEVYKPYGKNLYYYDVNSLYPFAALNNIPGSHCSFIENIDGGLNITDLFGFFYCEVETTNSYLGLLPVHAKEGLIMPNGSWKGWYFSEELKYALSQGYKIKVIKGYKFNQLEGVFDDYVNDFYKVKSTTNDMVEKDINKRLLNHLLGRFGMNIVKPITELVDGDKFSLIESSRKTQGEPKVITDNDYWVTYYPEVDPDICKSHGLDYFKVCDLNWDSNLEGSNEFKDVSLTTAAAVTAYARIYMSKIKMDVLSKGGSLYYTDTDSIVTDVVLDDKFVGSDLGQFKLEHKVKKGYFISNKTYCLHLFKKIYDKTLKIHTDTIIRSKSVDSKSLNLNSFKDLYNGISVKATKRYAITDHSKGSVLIVDNPETNLNHDSYTKRVKLFKRSKWFDTKPLVLKSSVLDVKPKKVIKLTKTDKSKKNDKLGKSSELVKKSKPIKIDKSLDKLVLIENTVKRDKFNIVKLGILNYLPALVSKKVYFYFNHVYRGILSIYNFISMVLLYITTIIGFIFVLFILFALVSLFTITNNEGISLELENILESRYNDDYMEEPIEIEMFESTSYGQNIKNYLKTFIDLFTKNGYESYSLHKDGLYNYVPQFVPENVAQELPQTIESSAGYRPQVLTSVLKYHLESSAQDYDRLVNRLSMSELARVKRDNLVWEAVAMCKKALLGESYESPILGHNSPILWRSSNSMLDYEGRFRVNNTVLNSPVLNTSVLNNSVTDSPSVRHQALINDITTLLNSPSFKYSPVDNNSPVISNSSNTIGNHSPVIGNDSLGLSRNSPIFGRNSPISGSNSPTVGGNVNALGLTTSFVENPSSASASSNSLIGHNRYDSLIDNPKIESTSQTENSGQLTDDKNTFLSIEHSSNIIKPPLREIYSPNTLKRFGHVWPDRIDVVENQDSITKAPLWEIYSPKTLRRFGHVWTNDTSILDYRPMKRYGGVNWSSPKLD